MTPWLSWMIRFVTQWTFAFIFSYMLYNAIDSLGGFHNMDSCRQWWVEDDERVWWVFRMYKILLEIFTPLSCSQNNLSSKLIAIRAPCCVIVFQKPPRKVPVKWDSELLLIAIQNRNFKINHSCLIGGQQSESATLDVTMELIDICSITTRIQNY